MVYLMRKYKDQVILFHNIILALIVISLVQNFFGYLSYLLSDTKKDFSAPLLTAIIVFLAVARESSSRVITLLFALGFQIVIKSVRKYKVKIGVLTFLYSIFLAIILTLSILK